VCHVQIITPYATQPVNTNKSQHNHKYQIKITGPTGIAHIFCDQPHGAQLKKGRLAGWFLNMKAGLERAGYIH
jgi:hypothetical protein